MVTRYSRILFLSFFAIIGSLTSISQSDNPKYDKAMADSLGGDDYGMKKYVLVILKTGSRIETNKSIVDSLFRGHMQNINRLAGSGKLVIAGPLVKNEKNYRGIFILNVASFEEAQKLLEMDPAIHEKLLDVEMFQWYGSAAISEYLKAHERIEKKKF